MENRYDMKCEGMGKITQGIYKNIIIEGCGKFLGEIDAQDIYVEGSCKAMENIKCNNLSAEGSFKAEESIDVKEKAVIEGICKVKENIQAKELRIEGEIKVGGLMSADDINIKISAPSGSYINEIGGGRIEIKFYKNGMGWLFSKSKNIIVNSIEGDDIYLENTKCSIVRGAKVVIGKNCSIEKVEYTKEFKTDDSSKVNNVVNRGMENE